MASTLLPAGYVSLDPTNATTVTVDIYNQTGSNASAFPDTTWPITTELGFSSISLQLNFTGGGSVTERASQFLSDGSGGFTGQFRIDLAKFSLSDAVLTGVFSPGLVELNDATVAAVYTTFETTLDPSAGSSLQAGDFAIIDAALAPEPGSLGLLIIGFGIGAAALRRGRGVAA